MAVAVGNLLRRLEALEVEKTDFGDILLHLTRIQRAFDQLQPYVHDAERKRDLYNRKWRRKAAVKVSSKQQKLYEMIANWVLCVAALATEVDHIIISYTLYLCNTSESSPCNKFFNLHAFSTNRKKVLADIQTFLEHSRLPTLASKSPNTSQQQSPDKELELLSVTSPETTKVSPRLKSSYSFTCKPPRKKLQLLRSKSGPPSLPKPSSSISTQWVIVSSPLPDHESSQSRDASDETFPSQKKLPLLSRNNSNSGAPQDSRQRYNSSMPSPQLVNDPVLGMKSNQRNALEEILPRSNSSNLSNPTRALSVVAHDITTQNYPQLLRNRYQSKKNLPFLEPESSNSPEFSPPPPPRPWDSYEDEDSEKILLLPKGPVNGIDPALSPQLQRSQRHSSWDIISWFKNFTLKANHDGTTQVQSQYWLKLISGMGLTKAYKSFSKAVVEIVKVLIQEAKSMSIQSDRESLLEPNALRMPIQTILESRKTNRRAEELRKIELWLHQANKQSKNMVIGITGMDGTGKTTLATLVRTHMQRYFDCHAWVDASPVHKRSLLEDVLKGILRSTSVMIPEDLATIDEGILRDMVKQRLSNSNFLLFLDDVQKPQVLEDVMNALPSDCKVNIICTSRERLSKCTHVLRLTRLNFQNSFNLLESHVTVREEYFPTSWWYGNSEAQDTLTICNGNLFAIATIGGMLSTKGIGGTEWTKISNWLKKTHFIPLSYADMKPVLKSCFLYAASFPSRVEISCKKLQRLWIAEGFVEVGGSITSEAAAKKQLDELIQRNMFQVGQVSLDGEVITCHILEPIRKFALGRSQEDQFCTVSDYKGSQVFPKAIHRLFLQEEGKISQGVNFDKTNLTQLYSYLTFKGNGQQQQKLFLDLSYCRHLSVLELQQVPGNSLPDAIGDLSLLRYLGLRGTRITKVPKSLKKLKRLQTLDIRNTFVRDLPANLDGLTMLRYLLLAGSFSDNVVNLEAGIEVFKDLQTLAGIKLTDGIVKGLTHLPQLQKLSVGNVKKIHSAYLFQSVEQMKFLHSLTIKCSFAENLDMKICKPLENLEKLRIGGRVTNLISWISKLNALKYLYLWDSNLAEDPFPALEQLPNLFVLSLCNAYDGETIQFSPEGFCNLKKLSILHCKRLKQCIEIKDGAMEKLQMLIIAHCPKLSKLPDGMDKLKSLEALHVSNMSKDFINNARGTHSLLKKQFSLHLQDTSQFDPTAHVKNRLPVIMPAQRFKKTE